MEELIKKFLVILKLNSGNMIFRQSYAYYY